jgi:Tfp pilus assembly protein FimT
MSMRRRRQIRRAFTLVELVIMILVLGIVAGTAGPKYVESLAYYRVQAAAQRVAADLRLAREYAQKDSQPQTVDFDVATDSYAMSSMPDPIRPSNIYAVSLSTAQSPVDLSSANFEGVDAIQFDIYGRANREGSVVVQSRSKQRTVQVDKAGNVSIL